MHKKKTNIIILFKFSETDAMWWYIPQDLFYSNTRATFFFLSHSAFFSFFHRNTPLIWYIVLFTSRDQSLVAGGAAKLYEKDGETLGYSVLFLKILFFFLLFSFRCDDKGESAYMDKTMH